MRPGFAGRQQQPAHCMLILCRCTSGLETAHLGPRGVARRGGARCAMTCTFQVRISVNPPMALHTVSVSRCRLWIWVTPLSPRPATPRHAPPRHAAILRAAPRRAARTDVRLSCIVCLADTGCTAGCTIRSGRSLRCCELDVAVKQTRPLLLIVRT